MSGYRITVRRSDEPRGTAVTRLSPLRRAKAGANAGIALVFDAKECAEILPLLRERHAGLVFGVSGVAS